MKKLLLFAPVMAWLCSACGSGSSNGSYNRTTYTPPPAPAMQQNNPTVPRLVPADTGKTIQPQPVQVTRVENTNPAVVVQPGPPVPVAQPVAVSAKGLNPAHGQPGHRCDIAVGAPLNSAPVAPVAVKPPVQQVTTPQAPVKTAPGMNPPHGQPGHRCDISVGAPLNSKPNAAPAPQPVPVMTEQPVKKDSL